MVSQLPFLQCSSPFATEQPELSTDKSGYVTSLLKTFHKLLSTWIRNLNCLPETMWTLPDLALSNPIFYSSAPHSALVTLPFWYSLNSLGSFPPQSICPSCSLCLKHSSTQIFQYFFQYIQVWALVFLDHFILTLILINF